jgi:hypothetical protein
MTVGDILDGVFKLFKANARAVVTIVAVFIVPLQLGASFAQRDTFGGAGFLDAIGDPSLLDGQQGTSAGDIGVTILVTLAGLIIVPFMAGAISQIVGASYLGESLAAGPALRRTLRRFWSLLGGWFVSRLLSLSGFVLIGALALVLVATGATTAAAVVAVLGFLFLGIPVLVAVSTLAVAVAPAIVVEELGPIVGVRRSWRLMRPRFWGVLGISMLAGLIAGVISFVLSFVPSVAALVVGLEHGWVLLAVGAILASLVSEPVVAIAATLLYFDARIRNEGFDLQIIAAELSGTGAAP